MFEMASFTLFARQVANGTMTISAMFLIGVFVHYIWINWPHRKDNVAIKAAIAILVLTCGHVIRSLSGWLEFMWVDLGWSRDLWLQSSWAWFIAAASLVLIGKALMLLNFSPWAYRKKITVVAIATAIVVPALLALFI